MKQQRQYRCAGMSPSPVRLFAPQQALSFVCTAAALLGGMPCPMPASSSPNTQSGLVDQTHASHGWQEVPWAPSRFQYRSVALGACGHLSRACSTACSGPGGP
jgi:hypothetical protein